MDRKLHFPWMLDKRENNLHKCIYNLILKQIILFYLSNFVLFSIVHCVILVIVCCVGGLLKINFEKNIVYSGQSLYFDSGVELACDSVQANVSLVNTNIFYAWICLKAIDIIERRKWSLINKPDFHLCVASSCHDLHWLSRAIVYGNISTESEKKSADFIFSLVKKEHTDTDSPWKGSFCSSWEAGLELNLLIQKIVCT